MAEVAGIPYPTANVFVKMESYGGEVIGTLIGGNIGLAYAIVIIALLLVGKRCRDYAFCQKNHHAESEETLGWFKQSMEEQMHLSWREFGQVLENLGLRKESALFEITFCDGKLMVGKGINWND